MSASQDNTDELDKTLLGQLIAEIAKFGGSDKSKASQLAKILLPYIDAYANLARTEAAREARINFLKEETDDIEEALILWRKNERKHHTWLLAWLKDNERELEQLSTPLKSDGEDV